MTTIDQFQLTKEEHYKVAEVNPVVPFGHIREVAAMGGYISQGISVSDSL